MAKPFDNISVKEKEKLFKSFEAHIFYFPKNSSLSSLLQEKNNLGIILNGYVQFFKTDYNGNRIIMEELQEDELFGFFTLSFRNLEYEAIAKEDTDLLIIDYQKIIQKDDDNKKYQNQFIRNLLGILLEKIQEKNERIEILTSKTIRNKLLEYFNIVSRKHGSKIVYLPFHFTDLADYLAIDRCAMSRELKYLKEEGFIEIKGKRISLLYDPYMKH